MAERPPSRPRVAWEEERAPQESSSPPEPYEVCMIQPLQIVHASWLPVYEVAKNTVDNIQAFVSSPEKEEGQKMEFLESICILCTEARHHGLSQGLDLFCLSYELAENIKVLLEEEPRDQLCTAVRLQAMLAIARLSSVETVLEGKEKSLLEACFSSVFLLPPEEEMRILDFDLYLGTLKAMDTMLETLVRSFPASRVSEELQNIFQVLLNFTNSERGHVRERALQRIANLSRLLAAYPTLEAWHHFGRHICDPVCYGEIQIPILGQLLGRLLLFGSSKDETICPTLTALHCLHTFIRKQKSRSMLKDKAQQLHCEPETNSLPCSPIIRNFAMMYAKYLRAAERADIALVAIEAIRDSSIFDKKAARNMLDVVMRDPDLWLADVPKIMRSLHENLECIKMDSAWQSVESLLLLLTNQYPMQVAMSLLTFSPPADSTGVAMWEVMLSIPQTLEKILRKFLSLLRHQWLCKFLSSFTEGSCRLLLAVMASSEFQSEDVGDESHVQSYERHPSLVTVSLFLGGLIALSERPDMARKMQVLLPHIMEVFQEGNTDIKTKALVVFRNVMGHLKSKEASPMAVQLAEELLPLFDEESSQLRELSISLFRGVVDAVVGNDKRRMKKKVRRRLLPLFFHTLDETDSVAKASREALLAVAELLKWKQLKHLVQTQQTWRIGECLLVQDRSRAEEYCYQSLPYLKDAQATLREAAVRFIGLAARPLRDQSKEKVSEICSDLQTLEEDSELSIRSLVAQTILILGSPREQPRSGRALRELCCWCC